MNRFKGLELVNSVPEELWLKVCNTVKERVNKTIPKIKKSKKAKWLSEEALQTAKERSEKQGRKRKVHPTKNIQRKRKARRQSGYLRRPDK